MIRFGVPSQMMRHFCAGLAPIGASLIVLLLSPAVLSQSGTPAATSALTADINYRKRELEINPSSAEARAQLAIAYERSGDYTQMVETLSSHKDKIGRTGLVLLSRGYRKLARFNDEVAALELAIARYPKDPQLQTWLAGAQSRAGRKEKAIEGYYKVKEAFPKYIPGYEGLLEELVKADSRAEARDLISDMIKRFGERGPWLSQLCALFTVDAFYDRSIETCNKALKKDRGNPMNPVHLATTFRETGEPDKAKKVLISAAMKIKRSEPIQTALGDYFVEKKNFVDAFRWYSAAIKADPKSYRAQLGFAQSAFELQKMEESIRGFTAICKMDRAKAVREFQTALGKLRQRSDFRWQGRFEDAISSNCQPNL